MGRTLFDKLWKRHKIRSLDDGDDLIAIDRVLLHERTGAACLNSLAQNNRTPLDPSRVFCIIDHIVSNQVNRQKDDARSPNGEEFIKTTRLAAQQFGLNLIDTLDPEQGITHVIAPELGLALPGYSIICPDSHTCTLGALGSLAWGVGSSAAEHAIATGTIRVKKPKQMRIVLNGALTVPATAKDLALALIAAYGCAGGKRHAIEFSGTAIDKMSVEERLTLCNMAVEFSAFTALIAPDEKTKKYVANGKYAPDQSMVVAAQNDWQDLYSDADASFDQTIELNASEVRPMVSWGTSPQEASRVNGTAGDDEYMNVTDGNTLTDLSIDGAFIGSCTNGRLSDLQSAARYLAGKKVSKNVKAICVPGSQKVKLAAEAEGLDEIFKKAGFEWGEPGCAFCFYAGGETFAPGARVISSTNRNFEGRQGPNVRTHLASPATVAASAVAGKIVDLEKIGPV